MIDIMNLGLSGMQSFQQGLSNIGNNLVNMNTPGFKKTILQYSDLGYQYTQQGGQSMPQGSGVKVGRVLTDFTEGSTQNSTNALDLAIIGEGFFVSRLEGKLLYSRVGQCDLDSKGFLINRANQSRIQALNGNKLQDFSVAALKQQMAKPTSRISCNGNLSSGTETERIKAEFFDPDGVKRIIEITFTNNSSITPNSWRVEVEDITETPTFLTSGEIRFNTNGSPMAGFNDLLVPIKGANGQHSYFMLDFGLPGSLSGTTNLAGGTESTVQAEKQDGYGPGSMIRLLFDSSGAAQIEYSNGQKVMGETLALAWFSQPQDQLKRIGTGFYQAKNDNDRMLGQAGSGRLGEISSYKLEMSNVDLVAEFNEMMIAQRGYQSASQLISAANEMMQQALQMKGGR